MCSILQTFCSKYRNICSKLGTFCFKHLVEYLNIYSSFIFVYIKITLNNLKFNTNSLFCGYCIFYVPFFRFRIEDFQIMSDLSSIARQRKCPCFMTVSVCSRFKGYFFTECSFNFFESSMLENLVIPFRHFCLTVVL